MLQSIEAITDQEGKIRLLDPIRLPGLRRVIITILDDEPSESQTNLALVSEASLARDWARPEEDEAWSLLGQLPSL